MGWFYFYFFSFSQKNTWSGSFSFGSWPCLWNKEILRPSGWEGSRAGEGGEVVLGWVPAQEGLSDLQSLVMPTPEPSPAHQSPTLRLSFKELQICVIEKKNACSSLHLWKIQGSRERCSRP